MPAEPEPRVHDAAALVNNVLSYRRVPVPLPYDIVLLVGKARPSKQHT